MGLYSQAEATFSFQGLAAELAWCRNARADALAQLGRYAEAVAVYERINLRHSTEDELLIYHTGFGNALWQVSRPTEALEQITRARHALRQARRKGEIDETYLEFVEKRTQKVMQLAVQFSLAEGGPSLAFAAVQDGKAGVLSDLRQRSTPAAFAGDPELSKARRNLCHWLRDEREARMQAEVGKRLEGQAIKDLEEQQRVRQAVREELHGELERETEARTRLYFKTWRLARGNQAPAEVCPPEDEETVSLKRIQAALPADWALLDFWVLDEESVLAFVVTQGELEVELLPVRREDREVQAALRDLRGWAMTGRGGRDDGLGLFYDLLFAPLLPLLRGIKGLYLVPHNYLHLIPLTACHNQHGRYLGEEFAVAYLPSASLLPDLPSLSLNGRVLTLANPDRGTPQTLPFSEWEADQVRRILASRQSRSGRSGGIWQAIKNAFTRHKPATIPEHQLWLAAEATLDKTAAWQQFSLVHFTCHGSGNMNFAPLSYLRLADDLLLAHDIVYQQPQLADGALAVLNGCQTAVRDWRAVDEGLGLMSSFLVRGASLVLATQWSVDDLCAAEMVRTFVHELVSKGQTPTDALWAAQQRAQQITTVEAEALCQTLLQNKFPPADFPHEAAKLNAQAVRACLKRGNVVGARHYAHKAATVLRTVGMRGEADQIAAAPNSCEPPAAGRSSRGRDPMYDHPVFWSGFQLVGRAL